MISIITAMIFVVSIKIQFNSFAEIDFFLTLGTFIIGTVKGVETALVIGAAFNLIALLKIWSRPQITAEVRKVRRLIYF